MNYIISIEEQNHGRDHFHEEEIKSGKNNHHDAKEIKSSSKYIESGIRKWDYADGLFLRRDSYLRKRLDSKLQWSCDSTLINKRVNSKDHESDIVKRVPKIMDSYLLDLDLIDPTRVTMCVHYFLFFVWCAFLFL